MTVCQLYEKYTRQRGNVRKGTQKSRQQLMKLLSEDKLGAASIDSVKLSDAKEWALRMQEKGRCLQHHLQQQAFLKSHLLYGRTGRLPPQESL